MFSANVFVIDAMNVKIQKFLTHEQRFHCRAVREQGFCPWMLFIHILDQWTLAPTSWLKRLSSSSPSPSWSAHLVVWRRGGDLSYASPRSGGKWGHHPSGAVPTVRLDHRRHTFNLFQRQGCKLNLYMQIRCQTLISSFIRFSNQPEPDWKGLVPFTQLVNVRRGRLVLTLPSIRFAWNFHHIISNTKYE